MNMHIHKAGKDEFSRRIDDLLRLPRDPRADLGNDAVFDQNILHAVDSRRRIDQMSVFNKNIHSLCADRFAQQRAGRSTDQRSGRKILGFRFGGLCPPGLAVFVCL